MTRLTAAYPAVFANKVSKLKDYSVKLYIDERVKSIAEQRRSILFHLHQTCNAQLERMEVGRS